MNAGPFLTIGAGIAGWYASTTLADPKARIAGQLAGGAAVAAGLWWLLSDTGEGLLSIGKPRDAVEDITAVPLEDVHRGSPAATGVIQASIRSPIDGSRMNRSDFLGSTYPVTIELKSSRNVNTTMRLSMRAEEFYSFGGTATVNRDFGTVTIKPGEGLTIRGNMQIAESGVINPFSPPEVSLSLIVDGQTRDAVRFTYE